MIPLMLQATIAVSAKHLDDPRYTQLVDRLCERLSMPRDQVEANIVALSQGRRPTE